MTDDGSPIVPADDWEEPTPSEPVPEENPFNGFLPLARQRLLHRPQEPDPAPSVGVGNVIGWTILYLLTAYGPAVLFLGHMSDSQERAISTFICLVVVSQVFGLWVSWMALRDWAGPDWGREVGLRVPEFGYVILAALLLPGMMLAASTIAQSLTPSRLRDDAGTQALAETAKASPVLFVLAVGVLVGTCEELWFRGFLGGVLTQLCGPVRGVILTSVLFAAAHLSLSHFIPLLFMGVVLHLVYQATRSLWVPILLHVGNNSLAVLSAGNWIPDTPMTAILGIGWFLLLACAFACVRAEIVADDGSDRKWRGDRRGTEVPSPLSGFRLSVPHSDLLMIAFSLIGLLVIGLGIVAFVNRK